MKYHCKRCDYEGEAAKVVHAGGFSAAFCPMCSFTDALVPLHEWRWVEEARANSRKARRVLLFQWSVIIAALCGVALYLGITIAGFESMRAVEVAPRPVSMTLPQRCAKYHIQYHGDELWNEETQSYPPNHAWMDCMGVGVR